MASNNILRVSPRQLENLPRFVRHLESVEQTTENRSHWRAKGPAGTSVQLDAEIVEKRAGELISWRSLSGAHLDNAGSVRFERTPDGHGSFVRVTMDLSSVGRSRRRDGREASREDPNTQVQRDLNRLKQIIEAGELATHRRESALLRPSPE